MSKMIKCEDCGEQKHASPPPEEWGIHRFCIKLFSWRILFIKHEPEYFCSACMADKQQSREREQFDNALNWAISEEITKGNLIPRNKY